MNSEVENCYFPMCLGEISGPLLYARFIPKCYMEKESDHLDDFAPELAMVTKFGNEERCKVGLKRPC